MAGFVGADVDQLRAFAKLVDTASRQLDDTATGLSGALAASRWLGPDASDFTARWNSQYRPGLTRTSGSLHSIVTVLIENADQQHATSSDIGGDGGGTGGHASGSTDGKPTGGLFDETIDDLDDMTAEELRDLAEKYSKDPEAAHDWWASLTDAEQARLIEDAPELVGGLDGVPALDRVAANANIAGDQISVNNERIDELRERIDGIASNPFSPISSLLQAETMKNELAALIRENGYLQLAADGDVQLYTYDREADRIVEMIGDPETATKQLTWIPGTATDLSSFYGSEKGGYGDGIQGLPASVAGKVPGTVVFVMKDGYYPQWDLAHPPSDTSIAMDLGKTQAQFQSGLDASGFSPTSNTAVGHSVGLAILTASEQAGAHYDNVVSLSGIGMDGGWERQAGTQYYDYTTDGDAILVARGLHGGIPSVSIGGTLFDPTINVSVDNAGFPLTPSAENGFTVLDSGIGLTRPDPSDPFPLLTLGKESAENHSLIASTGTSVEVKQGVVRILTGLKPAGS